MNDSAAKAWMRALERTASISLHPERVFPTVIQDLATQLGETPALLSDRECLSYRALAERSNRYARWALAQGLGRGEAVALFMPNRPEYLAIWLGITQAGAVVALLNTNLTGRALVHCIGLGAPKHIIAEAALIDPLIAALPEFASTPTIWAHGDGHNSLPRIDHDVERYGGEQLTESERRPLTIEDRALYIYTSGTTGLPKAAIVSHGRIMQWTHWFAGMMDTRSTDRMYDCLPMYHSVGGVQAPGAVLAAGGSVAIGEKFSARRFWSDIARWDCTLFQYIGELCRYLLHSESSAQESAHRIRMACGNGLRPDIWDEFKDRFRIPRILEFYAATEGNVSWFNVEGERGSIGRVPSYLAHRFPAALVKFDVATESPIRNEQGFCIRCVPNEVGEAIGRIFEDARNFGGRFEGYTSDEASEKKILRNVFAPGDAWFRTGDLMRRDARGFFYFIDRIGDTFRWKGENVATSEVSEAICEFPGVEQANVYGVAIPGADGRACMATLVISNQVDLTALRAHLNGRLPDYARPLFLRIASGFEVTSTFKYTKMNLVSQGYDPTATADAIYFNDPEDQAFIRVGEALYRRICTGNPLCTRAARNDAPKRDREGALAHERIEPVLIRAQDV
jgi:fatty-acyl-CoA synthase